MFIALVLAMCLTPVVAVLSQAHCLKDVWVKCYLVDLACNYSCLLILGFHA